MELHLLLILILVASAIAAPKSRSDAPSLVYDQKQKGDYNLQLSVKDLHVIALLSDDVLDASGDYDYNYDYSDFTIRPRPSSSTTSRPENCTGAGSDKPPSTTEKDAPEHPASVSPAGGTSPSSPGPAAATEKPPGPSVAAELESRPPSSTYKPVEDAPPPPTQNSTASGPLRPESGEDKRKTEEGAPDRIKVQIIQSPEAGGSTLHSKVVSSDEEEPTSAAAQLGETLHYRRCLSGFTRDKKGRCRRVRRPGAYSLPFGISRLASNLAALTGATLQHSPASAESSVA